MTLTITITFTIAITTTSITTTTTTTTTQIRYYDGQFDDARLNVTLACTAAAAGAAVANHCEATALLKDGSGRVVGVKVHDRQSGRSFDVHARLVINATGPWADRLRRQSDPRAKPAVTASAGAHVTLPDYYGGPSNAGMIVPKTKDGRVVFMLPWEGRVIAGTTDGPVELTDTPAATGAEVDFILDALSDYLSVRVRRQDVLSAWSGIRPLASDPTAQAAAAAGAGAAAGEGGSGSGSSSGGGASSSGGGASSSGGGAASAAGGAGTASIVREHVIFADRDGLLTVRPFSSHSVACVPVCRRLGQREGPGCRAALQQSR